jgi:Glycosyltransferase family 87
MGRLTTGAWLTRERVTIVAAASAIGGAILVIGLMLSAHGTVDAFGRPLGTDFSVFWNAGRMALHGQAGDAWNPDLLNAAARHVHQQAVPASAWLYPPVFLFVACALAMLPYVAALLAWQLVSFALATVVARLVLKDKRAILVALASPLTAMVLAHGQNSFLTLFLLGGGLLFLDGNPYAAGTLLGALIYKPQLALMLAPMLLFGRDWRIIAAAILAALVLAGASALVWGPESWRAFFVSLHFGRTCMEQGLVPFWKSAGLFAMARQWGANIEFAYLVQALGAAAALALLSQSRDALPNVRNAAACAAIALSTPYLLDYDMIIVGLGGAFLYREAAAGDQFLPGERNALAFIWFAPWFARPAAQFLTLPFGPIATLLLAWMACRRTRSGHRHAAVHVQRLAGDVAGLTAREIDGGRADILA